MWNWLVSALQAGAAVVLWDGSPVHPSPTALWDMAAEVQATVFGTSPKYLAMCQQEGLAPLHTHDLTALRSVLSTGAPLSIEGFHYVYEAIKPDVQLSSIAGGTDIISCFMLGCPVAPVYAGEIQKRGLGMAVAAWRDQDDPVVGAKAELVCTQPFPSMPVGFWNDDDGQRYHRAYFDHFPGVWRHGDFIEITEHGGVIVYGRSDATLNPGGVRIGTAEIYRPVEAMDGVIESVVVGLPTEDEDVEVVLFVVLADGSGRSMRSSRRRYAAASGSWPPRGTCHRASSPHPPCLAPSVARRSSSRSRTSCRARQPPTGMPSPILRPLDWFATTGREALAR